MTKIVIIGCGDAGLSAASSASRQDRSAEITVISKEDSVYPRCPLPYFIGGQVSESDLVRPLSRMFSGSNIQVVIDEAVEIGGSSVKCLANDLPFDKAILATGGTAKCVGGSLTLRSMEDARKIKSRAQEKEPTIIGGGMLGCELADMLGGTILEREDRILSAFDPDFSEMIEQALLDKGVKIITGSKKSSSSPFPISSIGVSPDVGLAKKSGIKTSEFGIKVDKDLLTNRKHVYAAGDCIEERCFLTGKPMHSYLGPQAEREGTIAGINAAGGKMHYKGSLNSVVAKIAGIEIGRTGLCSMDAKEACEDMTIGKVRVRTKPDYFPGVGELTIKMIFGGKNLVGCQAIGDESVDGIINLASYAMQHGAKVDDLINLDYCYSPPICSAPNPVILCAQNAKRRM